MSNVEIYFKKALSTVEAAIEADNNGKLDEAFILYKKALEWFQMTIRYSQNAKMCQAIKLKMGEYITRAEELQKMKSKPVKDVINEDEPVSTGLESTIVAERPNVKWEQVAGLDQAKETLQEAAILPMKFPHLFVESLKPWKGILLYGPPGTGKSYLAKALATEANSTFFNVTAADLVSKWVGDSEKLVKSLFQMAREKQPSIIFIDEIDSLCSNRSENDNSGISRLKTEFLAQMESVTSTMDGILLLGATNLPWNLDIAMRRRFERRVYIPLPSEPARTTLFTLNIGTQAPVLTKENIRQLAKQTEGYSGADITLIVRDALMQKIRRIQTSTHFKVVENEMLEPCSPGDLPNVEMTWKDVETNKLKAPEVSFNDFLRSIQTTKPSVGTKDLIKYVEWTTEFGIDG